MKTPVEFHSLVSSGSVLWGRRRHDGVRSDGATAQPTMFENRLLFVAHTEGGHDQDHFSAAGRPFLNDVARWTAASPGHGRSDPLPEDRGLER
jgi:hypothetical protein